MSAPTVYSIDSSSGFTDGSSVTTASNISTDIEMDDALENDAASSEVQINIDVEATAVMLLESAKEDLERKKARYYVLLGNYLSASKANPGSNTMISAFAAHKDAQESFLEAQKTLNVLKASNTPVREDGVADEKKSSLVPGNLPFLQMRTDSHIVKPNRDVFESVYDFCQEFTTVLETHSLSLDDSWERLLPACLNNEEKSWFEDKLKGKALKWKQAESIILDHYDTPFRKFLNMGRVWCMKQGKGESARSFGAKFQKSRRQACLEDGIQLVLCFWLNLRPEVRQACLIPLSANYGTKMPTQIEDIISLVSAVTSDSSSLLNNPGETRNPSAWNSFAAGNGAGAGASSGAQKIKERPFSGESGNKKQKKSSWDFKKAIKEGRPAPFPRWCYQHRSQLHRCC